MISKTSDLLRGRCCCWCLASPSDKKVLLCCCCAGTGAGARDRLLVAVIIDNLMVGHR